MISISVVGDDALAAELLRASGHVGFRTAAATRKTAKQIESTAKQLVPKRSGDTRDSISTVFEGDGRSKEMSAEIGAETFYARFLEYGTVKMAPHAFMGPSFDLHAPAWVEALEEIAADI